VEFFRDLLAIPPPEPDPYDRASGHLTQGDVLFSATRAFKLIFQTDGNLVLYAIDDATLPADITQGSYSKVIWATGTNGTGATACVMQTDGNLVLYTAEDRPVWAAGTNGHPGAFLRCQDDGNLVIYVGGTAVWASNTYARPQGGSMGRKSPPDGLTFGYSFQLNSYSEYSENQASAWQQYVFAIGDGQVKGLAQVWSANLALATPLAQVDLGWAPSWPIAAGTRFQIQLGNDQENNVIEATFQIYTEQGLWAEGSINVAQIPELLALSPIVASQLNIVGPVNGESVMFSSGAGTITYLAASELTAMATLPGLAEAQGVGTVESANTAYGTLPAKPGMTFSQSFQISAQTPT
jgi:hypothetical protein